MEHTKRTHTRVKVMSCRIACSQLIIMLVHQSIWGPHGGERSIWLHHPCLRVPMVEIDQYGYIAPAFSGSP